jgi:hypothetical protein
VRNSSQRHASGLATLSRRSIRTVFPTREQLFVRRPCGKVLAELHGIFCLFKALWKPACHLRLRKRNFAILVWGSVCRLSLGKCLPS